MPATAPRRGGSGRIGRGGRGRGCGRSKRHAHSGGSDAGEERSQRRSGRLGSRSWVKLHQPVTCRQHHVLNSILKCHWCSEHAIRRDRPTGATSRGMLTPSNGIYKDPDPGIIHKGRRGRRKRGIGFSPSNDPAWEDRSPGPDVHVASTHSQPVYSLRWWCCPWWSDGY